MKSITNHLLSMFVLSLTLMNGPVSAEAQIEWREAGKATGYWAGIIPVYDAVLFVGPGVNQQNLLADDTAIKLELCYRVELKPDNFIDAASTGLPDDIAPQIQDMINQLHAKYETVVENDCYTFVYTQETGTSLLLNGDIKFSGNVPAFKSVYLGIWLGEDPLSDSVKQDLVARL